MHADQCTADVHTGGGLHFLHQHGVMEGAPAVGGPAAARVGLGDGGYDLVAVLLGDLPLNHDGAVQMLAALGGQVDTLLLQRGQHTRQHSGGNLHARIVADTPAADLAAGTADNKDIAGLQMGSFQ